MTCQIRFTKGARLEGLRTFLDSPTTPVRKGADGAPSTARFRLDLARPGVLTEQQEGQQPLQHRRRLQPPRQRNVERRKLHLHGPAVASESGAERCRLGPRCSAAPAGCERPSRPAPGPPGAEEAATAPHWARTGFGLGWRERRDRAWGLPITRAGAQEQLRRPGRTG